MTNLETTFLEVLAHEAICFCSRVVQLFLALLTPLHTAITNDFAKKVLAGHTGHMIKLIILLTQFHVCCRNYLNSCYSTFN